MFFLSVFDFVLVVVFRFHLAMFTLTCVAQTFTSDFVAFGVVFLRNVKQFLVRGVMGTS